jgi:hypothetical protein
MRATPEYIDPSSSGLVAIRKLYEILDSGYIELGGRWVYSFSFFFIVRRIIRIVYALGKNSGFMPESENVDRAMFSYDKSHFANPDAIPIKKQFLLFLGIMKLFDGYPETVINYFNKNVVTRRDLAWGKVTIPFWCKHIIDSIDDRLYRPNKEEAWNAIRYARSKGLKILLSRDGFRIGPYKEIWDRKFLISLLRDLGVDLEFV